MYKIFLHFYFLDNAYLQEITNQELNKLNIKTANEIMDSSQSESNENENNSVEELQYENEGRIAFKTFIMKISYYYCS